MQKFVESLICYLERPGEEYSLNGWDELPKTGSWTSRQNQSACFTLMGQNVEWLADMVVQGGLLKAEPIGRAQSLIEIVKIELWVGRGVNCAISLRSIKGLLTVFSNLNLCVTEWDSLSSIAIIYLNLKYLSELRGTEGKKLWVCRYSKCAWISFRRV